MESKATDGSTATVIPATLDLVDPATDRRVRLAVRDGAIRSVDLARFDVDGGPLVTYDPALGYTAVCR
ncbi:MAG TPA: hypothetical protein VEY67_04950, partial [Candidatus Dormibacteraeota bacterium]|nr:hypothetical protein [Candidatus Dormibacteraeota bacterium]